VCRGPQVQGDVYDLMRLMDSASVPLGDVCRDVRGLTNIKCHEAWGEVVERLRLVAATREEMCRSP
jgi:hypothetical protein